MFLRFVLTLALVSSCALAQRGGGGGGGQMGGGMGGSDMGMMRPRGQSRFEQFVDKLKLNKDQKDQAQTIMDAAREESAPLREQVSKARIEIADVLINNKGDEELKKAQDGYAAVVAQMTGVEAKAFQKIYVLLKPNQQSKATQAWDLMADMFSGGGRGAGRGQGQARN